MSYRIENTHDSCKKMLRNPLTQEHKSQTLRVAQHPRCKRHSNSITLSKLDLKHAPIIRSLLSPSISKVLNCQKIESVEDARYYLIEKQRTGDFSQGIFHEDHGLIGMVGYQISEHTDDHPAFIHYWIAERFQRRGFASNAVKQLIDRLTTQKVTHLYADVFHYNQPSQQLLKSLGFKQQAEPIEGATALILRFELGI